MSEMSLVFYCQICANFVLETLGLILTQFQFFLQVPFDGPPHVMTIDQAEFLRPFWEILRRIIQI